MHDISVTAVSPFPSFGRCRYGVLTEHNRLTSRSEATEREGESKTRRNGGKGAVGHGRISCRKGAAEKAIMEVAFMDSSSSGFPAHCSRPASLKTKELELMQVRGMFPQVKQRLGMCEVCAMPNSNGRQFESKPGDVSARGAWRQRMKNGRHLLEL